MNEKNYWEKYTKEVVFTPGGDPLWCCPKCGGGKHLYGIEAPEALGKCPDCGLEMDGYKYD